jgi:hypothetical protein
MWKAYGKTTTLLLSWIVSSRNGDKCEMLPLETKQECTGNRKRKH